MIVLLCSMLIAFGQSPGLIDDDTVSTIDPSTDSPGNFASQLEGSEGEEEKVEKVEKVATNESSEAAALLPVSIRLVNGIVLTGSMNLQDIVTWSPASDAPVSLHLESGTTQSIDASQVDAIVQGHEASFEDTSAPPKRAEVGVEPSQNQTTGATDDVANLENPSASGQFSFINPAASRYLYAPSSIPLQQGQGYVSQKILFTSLAFGVTDNVTLLMGTLVPIPLISVVGGKYARQINSDWHVAAGAEVFFLPFANTVSSNVPSAPLSIGFVSATYGDLDSHITFATGVMYEQVFSNGNVVHPIMIAGHKRMSDRLAVVTENWILLNPDSLAEQRSPYVGSISSLAFRLVGRRDQTYQVFGQLITDNGYPRYTWDFGLVVVSTSSPATLDDPVMDTTHYSLYSDVFNVGPMPWIDYTWHFGPARRP